MIWEAASVKLAGRLTARPCLRRLLRMVRFTPFLWSRNLLRCRLACKFPSRDPQIPPKLTPGTITIPIPSSFPAPLPPLPRPHPQPHFIPVLIRIALLCRVPVPASIPDPFLPSKVHVYDLDQNKHEPMCDQLTVRKAKLTRICFNPKSPILLVGDDRGVVPILGVRRAGWIEHG